MFAGLINYLEVELEQEFRPLSLSTIQFFDRHEVLEILVIDVHLDDVFDASEF